MAGECAVELKWEAVFKGMESTPPPAMTYPLAARQVITAALATGFNHRFRNVLFTLSTYNAHGWKELEQPVLLIPILT